MTDLDSIPHTSVKNKLQRTHDAGIFRAVSLSLVDVRVVCSYVLDLSSLCVRTFDHHSPTALHQV